MRSRATALEVESAFNTFDRLWSLLIKRDDFSVEEYELPSLLCLLSRQYFSELYHLAEFLGESVEFVCGVVSPHMFEHQLGIMTKFLSPVRIRQLCHRCECSCSLAFILLSMQCTAVLLSVGQQRVVFHQVASNCCIRCSYFGHFSSSSEQQLVCAVRQDLQDGT